MLEIPESFNIAIQLNKTIKGKTIKRVIADAAHHKFAFYFGDPAAYNSLLEGKVVGKSKAIAGQVEIEAEDMRILFSDGINIRYYPAGESFTGKNQLQLEFTDDTAIICTVQMYGGLWVYPEGKNDNKYYLVAKEKPSPLTEEFDEAYFQDLMDSVKQNLSVKAFLATEQRIPGLGNGVLQDILFKAGIHPKSKLEKLDDRQKETLFKSLKETLREMTDKGGRDTEKDIFGKSGGYETILSKKKLDLPCPVCGGPISRQAYLGGNVYFCDTCQPLEDKQEKRKKEKGK